MPSVVSYFQGYWLLHGLKSDLGVIAMSSSPFMRSNCQSYAFTHASIQGPRSFHWAPFCFAKDTCEAVWEVKVNSSVEQPWESVGDQSVQHTYVQTNTTSWEQTFCIFFDLWSHLYSLIWGPWAKHQDPCWPCNYCHLKNFINLAIFGHLYWRPMRLSPLNVRVCSSRGRHVFRELSEWWIVVVLQVTPCFSTLFLHFIRACASIFICDCSVLSSSLFGGCTEEVRLYGGADTRRRVAIMTWCVTISWGLVSCLWWWWWKWHVMRREKKCLLTLVFGLFSRELGV